VPGDRFLARSAHVEHLTLDARWPGARPFHAAVTSRLIAIVLACMHASLKLVWRHASFSVWVCQPADRAGARLSIRRRLSAARPNPPDTDHPLSFLPTRLEKIVLADSNWFLTSLHDCVIVLSFGSRCVLLVISLQSVVAARPPRVPGPGKRAAPAFKVLHASSPIYPPIASSFRAFESRCDPVAFVGSSHCFFFNFVQLIFGGFFVFEDFRSSSGLSDRSGLKCILYATYPLSAPSEHEHLISFIILISHSYFLRIIYS